MNRVILFSSSRQISKEGNTNLIARGAYWYDLFLTVLILICTHKKFIRYSPITTEDSTIKITPCLNWVYKWVHGRESEKNKIYKKKLIVEWWATQRCRTICNRWSLDIIPFGRRLKFPVSFANISTSTTKICSSTPMIGSSTSKTKPVSG